MRDLPRRAFDVPVGKGSSSDGTSAILDPSGAARGALIDDDDDDDGMSVSDRTDAAEGVESAGAAEGRGHNDAADEEEATGVGDRLRLCDDAGGLDDGGSMGSNV